MITIFTPTYNRAYTLPRLYESLCRQTSKNFEWVVVDDGSADNTRKLISEWLEKSPFKINYIYQENQGKSAAHNVGVENAEGDLFTCVDSDDFLVDDAVESIEKFWKEKSDIIGIICGRGYDEKNSITKWQKVPEKINLKKAYSEKLLSGDTMLIYKTKIIKKYRFPKFKGEKFVPESFLYDQLDNEGKLFVLNKILYICEYLPDGYTASIRKLNALNPNGYRAYILQRISLEMKSKGNFKNKIFDIIRLISINAILKNSTFKDMRGFGVWRIFAVLLYPLGIFRYYRDFHEYIK